MHDYLNTMLSITVTVALQLMEVDCFCQLLKSFIQNSYHDCSKFFVFSHFESSLKHLQSNSWKMTLVNT